MNEIKIDNTHNWNEKHKKSLFLNYSKSRHFNKIWKNLESIYEKRFELLIDLNMEIIRLLIKKMKITTQTMFSSDLKITETGSDRILAICKKLNADVYISGTGLPSKQYLQVDDFQKSGIQIQYHKFECPVYEQCYKPFIPNLSTLDLLFNEGENSKKFLDSDANFDYRISN